MKKVQHMVLMKFKPETSDGTIAECYAKLAELQSVISGIEHYSGGPYASPEGLNKDFTHGFLMTFTDAAARDAYLPHPEHEKVKELLLTHLADVIVFDFEV